MSKRYITNDTASPIFVGGVLILPGTGREVDAAFLPPEGDEVPQEDTEGGAPDAYQQVLKELLASSVGKITAALPDLDAGHLAALEALESAAEKPRSTLLAAIAAEKLTRAQAAAGGAPT